MKIENLSSAAVLANGTTMPFFGLGVYKAKEGQEVINAVSTALKAGYRHIDTAAFYQNEAGVGKGIAHSGIARSEVFVTSKVWNSDQGYDSTLKAFDHTMHELDTEYLDLYLVHWPVKGKYLETWKALETIYAEKRVRAIGVSNFLIPHLEDLLSHCSVAPMVNQCEFHPYLQQPELRAFCKEHQIQFEAWSPLMQGKIFEVPLIIELAEKYKKSPVQIVLRWNLQLGIVTIPKSSKAERIISNAALFDFHLDEKDMEKLAKLDKNMRIGPDPANFDF